MDRKKLPIGVFDSGVGGISVLRELVKLMPEEKYLYFGDSANAPYGTKGLEQVRQLTMKNIGYLLERGVKSVVVACNTATSVAVADLRKKYPDLPLVGIEPAIKPAVEQHPGGRIIVMATPMTLRQEKFCRLMGRWEAQAQIVPLPCPGLMEYVERDHLEGEDLRKYLTELFWSVDHKPMDAIVLGCTHYPFAKTAIRNVVGTEVKIYDGGLGTAREMKRRLQESGLLTENAEERQVIFENSYADPVTMDRERRLCEKLFSL